MKNITKAFRWTFIFSLLSIFSFIVVSGFFRDPVKVAIAAMNNGNNGNGNGNGGGYVLINGDHNNGFFHKFKNLYDHDMICEVGQSQYEELAGLYGAVTDVVPVDGVDIPVVTLDDPSLTPPIIQDFLGQDGEPHPLHCQALREQNIFYLLFNANLS